MPFPEAPRVIYEKNPLESVLCQLRFPAILRIESEIPTKFQESIRGDYPLFKEKAPEMEVPQEILRAMGTELPLRFRRVYDFTSGDEKWTVSLNCQFLALMCRDYRRWEDFRGHLATPFQALIQEFSPAFFSRIGLRYHDAIVRSKLGLRESPWSELLAPHIAGELSCKGMEPSIAQAARDVVIRLTEKGHVRVRHGLAVAEGSNEPGYVIDSDFFLDERTEVGDGLATLDFFNKKARNLFGWCITPKLRDAMFPRPI